MSKVRLLPGFFCDVQNVCDHSQQGQDIFKCFAKPNLLVSDSVSSLPGHGTWE